MAPSRVLTRFFVILSYTNLYDYPGQGLIDFFSSCMYMDGLPETCQREVLYVSHVIIQHEIITLFHLNMINDTHHSLNLD